MRKGMSHSEAGKIGGLKRRYLCEQEKIKRTEEYEKNPSLCKKCGMSLPYSKKENIFCGHQCSAAFNNNGIRRHGIAPGTCIVCGKKLNKGAGKFCSKKCEMYFKKEETKKKIENGEVNRPQTVRKYLLSTREKKCEICELTKWNEKDIPLVMDHINGNPEDWGLNNLRLICCNCDAQTDTYKSKNRGNGRYNRRKRCAEGKSY